MRCAKCGATNPEGPEVRFCRACGAALASALPPVPAAAVDAFAPAQPVPPADGSNGQAPQAPPTLPAAPIVALPPAEPAISTAQLTQAAPAPGFVHIAVSPYGGFWVRLLAWLIDAVILVGTILIAFVVFGFTTALVASVRDAEVATEVSGAVAWLVIFVVAIPYWLLFPPLLGATPGKLALGYHIVSEKGRHVSVKRSVGRMLAQIPSAMVLGLGYAWIGFDSRKQGWHDQIAKTYVVRKELVRP